MSTETIQVVARKDGELISKKFKAAPYEFTIATRAKWGMMIADEDVELRAGEYKKIAIQEVILDADTLAIPCAFTYHAVASVLKVSSKEGNCLVEKPRTIKYVYAFGQETGKVRAGDLLGVLNIFPIMFTREAMKPVLVK
ncbi:protein of unknown function DUF22 [Methanococcoides vulcani]|uniref:DUF22 domain-containing protein n=1 Tax=Methanococcoides vulcani TaxID=1353158 RepID=A0A1H9YA46_9EURY|nr:DUF22 domain-containing protein [Methanococcoides vulcani]SES65705.1 protein of unknown function DUF22 [Methanococcoides vulcani]